MQLHAAPPRRSSAPVLIPQDVPVYRIGDGKLFADDMLYNKGQIIVWPDEPNRDMEPLNEMATKEMKKYLQKLDKCGRAVAAKNGTSYVGLEQQFEHAYEMARQEGQKVRLLNGDDDQPAILGSKKRKPQRAKVIEVPTDPIEVGALGPHSLDARQAVEMPGGDE